MPDAPLAGRLLIATPLIGDGDFHRTVVLLLAHGEDGAFGVVLNRASHLLVGELLPEWADHAATPGAVFFGGPVAKDSVVAVAEQPGAVGGGRFVTPDLSLSPDEQPTVLAGPVRLFAGSAGWGPGQLEGELAEEAWWVTDPAPGDVLTDDPDGLWRRVVRRLPGETAWFANFPDSDPALN